jgi:hypothetical protein
LAFAKQNPWVRRGYHGTWTAEKMNVSIVSSKEIANALGTFYQVTLLVVSEQRLVPRGSTQKTSQEVEEYVTLEATEKTPWK